MNAFNDKIWSVSVGEKSQSSREWPDWCRERNIKFDWDWTEHRDMRNVTMFNMYFETEADYLCFKLAWV